MITVQNLSFKFEEKNLLEDISVNIQKGKLYAIIGHNGSGKSTLIKLLAGENTPNSGSVKYNDKVIHNMPSKELAKNIAYLPQKLPDAHSFTVEELVMLGRYPWQKWLQKPNQEDHEIVATAMQQTQIDNKATQNVSTLSGGERARAWLAMCLAQKTDYLFLDEPLAALDIVYQVEILGLIKELVDQKKLGVVIVIHDINLAAKFCDEFIALKNGKLCHEGNNDDTMNQEVLKDIFGIELNIIQHPDNRSKVAFV